jgi:hypothetical protein
VTVTRFSAKFARRCDRCDWRIYPGHEIYRLDDGTQICRRCAFAEATTPPDAS